MCEGIQGKNIKTPKNGSMQARRQTVSTASPEVARESCHGVRPKIMQKKKYCHGRQMTSAQIIIP